jgi:hypothetical protein
MIYNITEFIKDSPIYLAAFVVLMILMGALILLIIMLISETKKEKQELNNHYAKNTKKVETEIEEIPPLKEHIKTEAANNVQMNAYKAQSLLDKQSFPLVHETEILPVPTLKQIPLAIISYNENGDTKEYEIFNNIVNIGRDPAVCDLAIPLDHYISRKHALLYCKNGNFFLTDLNSKNGTFINWEKLQSERQIFNNDIITLATTEFKFNIK